MTDFHDTPCFLGLDVEDCRCAVEDFADAVTGISLDYAKAIGLCVWLDHFTNLSVWDTGSTNGDCLVETLSCDSNELQCRRVLSVETWVHWPGVIEIAVIALVIEGDVDIDDVSRFERSAIRNTVANDFIDARADALGKAVILERRRVAVPFYGFSEHDLVNLISGDTCFDSILGQHEHLTS